MAIVRAAILEVRIRKTVHFLIRPPVLFLEPHDHLRVLNRTTQTAEVYIPPLVPLPGPRPGSPFIQVPAGRSVTRSVRCFTGTADYKFKVKMMPAGKWAKGNSDPVIIIDNP